MSSSTVNPNALVVVDADTHISEPYDLWTSRAPASIRDLVPQVRENEHGVKRWYVDGDQEMGKPAGPV